MTKPFYAPIPSAKPAPQPDAPEYWRYVGGQACHACGYGQTYIIGEAADCTIWKCDRCGLEFMRCGHNGQVRHG